MTDDWNKFLQDSDDNLSPEQKERDALDKAIIDYINSDEIEKVLDSIDDIEMPQEERNDQLEQIMLDTIQGLMQKFSNKNELIPVLNGMLHRVYDIWMKIKFWSNSRRISGKEIYRRRQIFHIYNTRAQVLLLFYQKVSGGKWTERKSVVSLRDLMTKGPSIEEEGEDYTGHLE